MRFTTAVPHGGGANASVADKAAFVERIMAMPNPLVSRLDGYRRWLQHEWSMWSFHRRSRRNSRRYEAWIRGLQQSPPSVIIGPDLPNGGVRGHLHGILNHSGLNVQLVPDEVAMGGLEHFTAAIRERFFSFEPPTSTVVHSHVLPWMIRWCRRQQDRGLRWIHTYHNMYFPEFARGALEPWQLEINEVLLHEARHADVRLSVSRWQQAYLLTEHGIVTDYLPNGVDVAACDRGRGASFRRRHKIHCPYILYVGRNDPVKNPVDFVRLAHVLPNHVLVMLGQGLDKESLRVEWEVEVPENMRVLGGTTPAMVQDALAGCAVLVVTSLREGLPTLVLEALAHRKPVIVPAEAGCVEAIGHGDFGAIYQPGEIGELAELTLAALGDPQPSDKGRQRILAEYDWRFVARQLDGIYRGTV